MTLEELQKEWKLMKIGPRKSHEELRRMMYASPAWRFRGLTRKEIWGLSWNGLVIIALIVVFDTFSSWFSTACILYGIIQTLDRYLGLRYLRLLPQKDTMQGTLMSALAHIKRMAIILLIVSILIWTAVVAALGTSVHLGEWNVFLWGLILLPLLAALIWWTSRTWSERRDEVKAMLKEFDEEASVAVPAPTK